jgi:ParB family chromosome partitioning protein
MPRKPTTVGNLALANFEDIFKVSTGNPESESVVHIPLTDLFPPEFHPFQVNDDEAMYRLVDSIKESGVREPGLARPRPDGGYELLCGNRRKRACELALIPTMPVIIRELTDNCAAIVMVESNLEKRDRILPSERAWSYKIMMEALNHNGVKGESHSHEILVARTGVKKSQLYRIIRLTELIVTLLDMVDANQIAFNPAVELSYLSQKEQSAVVEAITAYEVKPSLSQAVRLKKLKQEGKLTIEMIDKMLSEEKKPPKGEPTGSARYRRFFPASYSPKQIDEVIVELLTDWKAKVEV